MGKNAEGARGALLAASTNGRCWRSRAVVEVQAVGGRHCTASPSRRGSPLPPLRGRAQPEGEVSGALKLVECAFCAGTGKVEMYDGDHFRKLRIRAHVGLREMARRLGHSAPYVSDAERGRRAFPKRWVARYEAL